MSMYFNHIMSPCTDVHVLYNLRSCRYMYMYMYIYASLEVHVCIIYFNHIMSLCTV